MCSCSFQSFDLFVLVPDSGGPYVLHPRPCVLKSLHHSLFLHLDRSHDAGACWGGGWGPCELAPVGLVSCGSVSDASFPGTSCSSEPPAPCGPAGGERRSLCRRRPGGDGVVTAPRASALRVPSPVPCSQASSHLAAPVPQGAGVTSAVPGHAPESGSRPSVTPWSARWVPDAAPAAGPPLQRRASSAVVGSEPRSWVLAATRSTPSHRRRLLWGRVRTGRVGGWSDPRLSLECCPLTLRATWGHLGSRPFSCPVLTPAHHLPHLCAFRSIQGVLGHRAARQALAAVSLRPWF